MESYPRHNDPAQAELFALDHDMSQPVTDETIERIESQNELAGSAWSLAERINQDARDGLAGKVKLVDGQNRTYKGKCNDVMVMTKESQAQPERLNRQVDKTAILMHLKEDGKELYVQQAVVTDESSELNVFIVQTPEGGFDPSVKSELFGNAVLYALDVTFRGNRTGTSEERFNVMKKANLLQPASPEDVAYFANALGYDNKRAE